ncbi:MAG: putative quinol monooxygenase [Candidatus Gastranaerophilaceae bacterium]
MNSIIRVLFILTIIIIMGGTSAMAKEVIQDNNNGMIVRISEIEVYPEYLEEYLNYAKEVAQKSVEKEKDVISIYPMSVIKNNTHIRILEIYRNQEAYKNHIASPHFKKYKEGTLHMVKSLDLVDTYQLCPENFNKIFKKYK